MTKSRPERLKKDRGKLSVIRLESLYIYLAKMIKNAHRIGAIFYILWGILHVIIGMALLYKLFTVGSYGVMAATGSALPPDQIPHVTSPVLNGILAQYAWNILWPGLFAIAVGMFMNWKNSLTGYWFNLIVITLIDSGFVGAILIPGHITLRDGLPGPIFWLAAVIFSTLGILKKPVAE